ncbi:hypothetical protein [Longilinea arvoryzae]|uniref:hypothetical protein n=1 Tax=Longilinea arvoryzae TaxID=360412 RepID=UPI001260319B|nr:hypothetical protein [Longilinea arvoryzae]
MELGRYLVRELGFEDGVDTLGRWMSHHLAELIDKAEHGKTEDERNQGQKEATETILRIWEHRASLPGKAYPLKSYENILLVLDRLRPDNDPFAYYHGDEKDRLASNLFIDMSRLIPILLLMKISQIDKPIQIDPVALDALDETEQNIMMTILKWMELFEPTSERTKITKKGNEKETGNDNYKFDRLALKIINDLNITLEKLRKELGEKRQANHKSQAQE